MHGRLDRCDQGMFVFAVLLIRQFSCLRNSHNSFVLIRVSCFVNEAWSSRYRRYWRTSWPSVGWAGVARALMEHSG